METSQTETEVFGVPKGLTFVGWNRSTTLRQGFDQLPLGHGETLRLASRVSTWRGAFGSCTRAVHGAHGATSERQGPAQGAASWSSATSTRSWP